MLCNLSQIQPSVYVKYKGMFLYSAVSNLQDCSKRFTLYCLAELFNRTASRLLWEACMMYMQKMTFILGYLLDLLTTCSVKCVLLPDVMAATKNRTAKMAAFVSLRNIILRIFSTTCTQLST